MLAKKLGFDSLREEDAKLIARFEKTLATLKPDMTIFYQLLIEASSQFETEEAALEHFRESFYQQPSRIQAQDFQGLMNLYAARRRSNQHEEAATREQMRRVNPRFILRNYLLHQAIEELEKEGKDDLFRKLEEAIREPYSTRFDEFLRKRPDWASQKAGCSMLSCSS